eukprot:564162_1
MSSAYNRESLSQVTPQEARAIFRNQQFKSTTNGCCGGYLQAGVVILDKKYASDFQRFCELNPKAAPLLEVLQPGNPFTSVIADSADIRCCLPKYRIRRKDESFDVYDINKYWNDDMVTFFRGCSFSFEKALQNNGINMRHTDSHRTHALVLVDSNCVLVQNKDLE